MFSLLPYIKTCVDESANAEFCKVAIASYLKIPENQVDIVYLGQDDITKFSESNKRNKNYHHRFYKVIVKVKLKNDSALFNSTRKIRKKVIRVDGKKYKWFTLDDMLNNSRIMEVNSDVIDKIREFHVV